MKILGIETSCDETAVCVLEAHGSLTAPSFKVLGNALYSQTKIHEEYGGVFPMMAKREHAANLVPILLQALTAAGMGRNAEKPDVPEDSKKRLREILEREPGLFDALSEHVFPLGRPDIDAIAVTHGPGLEPALWVGVNFAQALSELWDIPLVPTNHMEGHIVSVLLKDEEAETHDVEFPALALLISGGHTELVLAADWTEYEVVGSTRDDAVGEAFDKAARMLGLPYPGGPAISKLANNDRTINPKSLYKLPRPMIATDDFDFSFSGLKTAVLYMVKKIPAMTDEIRRGIAREFEDAATDVLVVKTRKALETFGARTLILGGGVTANRHIRAAMERLAAEYPDLHFHLPGLGLSTDNAIMIAMAGFVRITKEGLHGHKDVKASGNLKL